MAGDRTVFRLDDVCTKIGSGATPRGGGSVYLEHGNIAFIRSQNVYNDGFHRGGLVYLTDKHADELSNVEVLEGDVLLNITGDSVARACQVDPEVLPARVNQHVAIIRPNPKRLYPPFLRYYLVSPTMQGHMLSLAGAGATRDALTKAMIGAFRIPAPTDLVEQQAITYILKAFDDKIELNRRMNETLEAMARAIFTSWFVDFDPVRAKAAGHAPRGLSPELAALFPDRFQDSELGKIPKGWRVGDVADLVRILRDSILPADFTDEVFDHYSIPAFDAGRRPALDVGASIKSQKFAVVADCVLVSKLNPATPRVWLPDLKSNRRPVASTEFLVCCPVGDSGCGRLFFYCLSCDRSFSEYLTSHASGTSNSHQRVRPQDFLEYVIPIPPEALAMAFEDRVKPIMNRAISLNSESTTLAALRDTLLPKLISGELPVPDAERIVRRAS